MGKLQSFLQLGGVFADFPAAAPAVACTYLANQMRWYRGQGRARPASWDAAARVESGTRW